MKKNDIAEHLSNGTVVNLKGSTFTIQECRTRSPIYMYQKIPIGYREPGDVKIDRFAFTDYSHESQQEFYDYIIRNHRTDVWICSWAEDTATNDIFDTQLGLQKVGTKVTTFGELIVYWFLPYSKDMFGESRKHPKVLRPQGVTINWKDKEGQEFSGSFIDLSARIILHEYDHLNGYTFFDRAKPMHMSQAKKRRKIYIRKAKRQVKEIM